MLGRVIERPKPCGHCGCVAFKVAPGKGPHAAALYCTGCGRFGAWLSKREAGYVEPAPEPPPPAEPMLFDDSAECPF